MSKAKDKRKERQKFTKEEDDIIIKGVKKYGEENWAKISKMLVNRTTRQVNERWKNYLSPQVSRSPWTPDEDKLLLECVQKYGQKWAQIAVKFPTRTAVRIKNRYHLIHRNIEKYQKEIQRKQNLNKQKKNDKLDIDQDLGQPLKASDKDIPTFWTEEGPEDNDGWNF